MPEAINWYPGHMKKTRELILNHIKAVDLVLEVLDARIPLSSRNPIIGELIGRRPRLVLLNKADLADPKATADWIERFGREKTAAFAVNGVSGQGLSGMNQRLAQLSTTGELKKPSFRALRMMIVGVPNVGKSSLINRLSGRKAAMTGDRPGVTRGKQWLTLENGMQLLDTPGILWPKFEDRQIGLHLAFCGSIRDEILDPAELALALIRTLCDGGYAELLAERYRLALPIGEPLATMEEVARKRGFLLSGGRIDYERTGRTMLDEFRAGKIGRITLEQPDGAFLVQEVGASSPTGGEGEE